MKINILVGIMVIGVVSVHAETYVGESNIVEMPSTCTTNSYMLLAYSPLGGANVKVLDDGNEIVNRSNSGQFTFSWGNRASYVLSHVTGGQTWMKTIYRQYVKNVTARQLWPHGKVEVSYDLAEDVGEDYSEEYDVVIKCTVNGVNYVAKELLGNQRVKAGKNRVVWDMEKDGIKLNTADAEFSASIIAMRGTYHVLDLSGGMSASSYPVSILQDVPTGGWTDEYKTTKLVLRRIEQPDGNVFYIGVFEVTQKQYEFVTGAKPSQFSEDRRPVENVSRDTVMGSFISTLKNKTGLAFDLPTGSQWEYACRAGTSTAYSYGDIANGDYMWYSENSGSQTHVVGTRLPNPWGLYDMHGNVCELTLDSWTYYWYSYWKYRGGGWDKDANSCTSSYSQNGLLQSKGTNYVGFRLVRTL